MPKKETIFFILLLAVVAIFCGVIIYVTIMLPSIETGLTLVPLALFLTIVYRVNQKRGVNPSV